MLEAPTEQLDHCLFPLIKAWDSPPKAIQILEVLDQAIFSGLASGLAISFLNMNLEAAIEKEHTTMGDLVKKATWRK